MRKIINYLKQWNGCFIMMILMACVTVGLLIWAFVTPPKGVIDKSVLEGSVLLFGYATLFLAWEVVKKGRKATVSHGTTSLTVEGDESKQE